MSTQAISWALETRGHRNAAQKLVLIVLADYHTEGQPCQPTTRELSNRTDLVGRSVLRHLENLEEEGFIVINRGATGDWRRPNNYTLLFNGLMERPLGWERDLKGSDYGFLRVG